MKKTALFFLILSVYISITANAQQDKSSLDSTSQSDTPPQITINESELPKVVMDAFRKTNKQIPITKIYVYAAYWQNQSSDSSNSELKTTSGSTTDPNSNPHQYSTQVSSNPGNLTKADSALGYTNGTEFYELEFTKDSSTFKSVYAKDGTFMHSNRIINDSELPSKVAIALRKSDYKDWDVISKKEKTDKKNPTIIIYILKIRKGENTHVLHYDQDGKHYKHAK